MDNSSPNHKNLLVELESLKSKEGIFKMKENNFIRDKEILEDSIRNFQTDIQLKSELIRSLRRDLNTQSSNLIKDLQIKNNELEKNTLENEELKKQNVIYKETVDHQAQRIEMLKSEIDKQQSCFQREIECKSHLAGFYESSCQQKENRILLLSEENEQLNRNISDLELKLQHQSELNESFSRNLEDSLKSWQNDKAEKDAELQRMKNEIVQLQQNGISEFHLERMNPIAAATLKVLKSSRGLMEIYSELHTKIAEADLLQVEKNRLERTNNHLKTELIEQRTRFDRVNGESEELKQTTEGLKSRLLALVTDLRCSESKRGDCDRQLLVTKNHLECANREVARLDEQVRMLIVLSENGSNIKLEDVDTDCGLYSSVQELQEANRSLRMANEDLAGQLKLSDTEQFKQRCEELESYADRLAEELTQLKQENSTHKSQARLHENQVKLLRFLIDLKAPGSAAAIESGLRFVEHGNVVCLDCEESEPEREMVNPLSESYDPKEETMETVCQQTELASAMEELLDNKRASDEVYVTCIEQMRSQLVELSRRSNDLQNKLDNCTEKLANEEELTTKYSQECSLLRSLNKNLSSNTANLESQIEDFKLKLETKISLLAERKAEVDRCKNKLDMLKSEQSRWRLDRDELMKSANIQNQIFANIKSLQTGAGLADHFYRAQTRNEITDLNESLQQMKSQVEKKEAEIVEMTKELDDLRAAQAIAEAITRVDFGCQALIASQEPVVPLETDSYSTVAIDNSALMNTMATISDLQQQLAKDKSESDDKIAELCQQIEKLQTDTKDLTQQCEFFETQIALQEKARQEILSENIKLTEEAHNMNATLKLNLSSCQEELVAVKIRLEEAENVERTVQVVIDRYVKEANEAKAKYKRELTLHAADSKLLNAAQREIDNLKASDHGLEQECSRLKSEKEACEDKCRHQINQMQTHYTNLESKIEDCEIRNERFHDQLQQISSQGDHASCQEIIQDLRNEINIIKMSSTLSDVQKERYENEIARLRDEINDMKEQSDLVIDRLNKSQGDENSSFNLNVEVIRESNHVLRQQKEILERSLINQTSKLEISSEQLDRLKTEINELKEDQSCMIKQKTDLEEEKNRWKDRCTKLVERAEQMDPEQYKNACNERDKFRKQIVELEGTVKTMTAESLKQLLELQNTLQQEKRTAEQLESNLMKVTDELSQVQLEVQRIESLLATKTKSLEAQEVTNNQLREIARKYKSDSAKNRLLITDLEKQISVNSDQLKSIGTEKEHLVSRIGFLETEVVAKQEYLGELKSRCECLERINQDVSSKLQQTNQQLEESLKRKLSEVPDHESEPDCKRFRQDSFKDNAVSESEEEDQEEFSNADEESLDEDDEGEEKETEIQTGEFGREEKDVQNEKDDAANAIESSDFEESEAGDLEEEAEEEEDEDEETEEEMDEMDMGGGHPNDDDEEEAEQVQIEENEENDASQAIAEIDQSIPPTTVAQAIQLVHASDCMEDINDVAAPGKQLEEVTDSDVRTEEIAQYHEPAEKESVDDNSSEEESSVVFLDDDSDADEKNSSDFRREQEEDFEALVFNVENTEDKVEDFNGNSKDKLQESQSTADNWQPSSNASVDEAWNEKLIQMISSSMETHQTSTLNTFPVVPRQTAIRGRPRRLLRRPNQTD